METISVKHEVLDPNERDGKPASKRSKLIASPDYSNVYCDVQIQNSIMKSTPPVKLEIESVFIKEESPASGCHDVEILESSHAQPVKQKSAMRASSLRFIRKEHQVPANKATKKTFGSCIVIDATPPTSLVSTAYKRQTVKQNVPLTEKASALPSLANQLFEISSQKVSTTCSFCTYSTSCESKLKKHLATHKESNMELYSCLICSFTTIYKYQLKTHTDRHSMEIGRHFCSYCNFSTLSQVELEDHSAVHEVPSTNVCEYCGYTSTHKASFNKHIRKHGRPCPLCSYVSFDKADMEKHCESHLVDMVILAKREPVSAKESDSDVIQVEGLNSEALTVSSSDSDDGGDNKTLSRHFALKRNEGPWACSMCQFSASSQAHLKQHFYKHTGKIERSFDIRRATNLTDNPPDKNDFKCSVCPFHTPSESTFNKHCAVHPQGGAHQCPHCERRATTKEVLDAHISRIHKDKAS